jgi:hypothetical protein
MDMANGEMDVSCVLSNGDVSSLFFIIAKKGKRLPLTTLDLHNSTLSSSGIRRLSKFLESGPRTKELRDLNLSSCLAPNEDSLERGACHSLASSLILQAKLHTLNLSHLKLTHTHVSILCSAFALPLEVLDLSGNKINNQGALRLFRLRHPTLRKLYLHNNDIKRDVVLQAHTLVCEMPRLAFLSVFSMENDLPIFTNPEEAERLRVQRDARLAEQERVLARLQGYGFFRPTLYDCFLSYKSLIGFNAETGECDFGLDVPDKPQITFIFPIIELPPEQATSGVRCIAEYYTGTGKTLAYALCEIHEGFPDLQVRFSSRVVNPHSPDVPESRAFNRLRKLREPDVVTPEGSPTTETPSTSSPLTQNSSFTSHRAESKVTAQTLTGTLFKVPECFQISFAEKEARKMIDPDVQFRNLEQLAEMWNIPLQAD